VSVDLLESAVGALGDLTGSVVFLGGATVGLWFTDPAARIARATYDVDVVAEVVTISEYESFQGDLRRQGFREDIESGVICRWLHTDGLTLDAVPKAQRLAGFSGRWLAPATDAAVRRELPSGSVIRVVPPPWLAVTKLEAFADRGGDDCLSSRDFEDLALLVDARVELADEVQALPPAARLYARDELARIADLPTFDYGLEGALLGADARARASAVTVPRWRQLAQS
jgi:predicted nucleotidyltransferase